MDTVFARRTHAGAPIVHGIHSLIWILECFAQSELYIPGARSLKAQFLQPIYVGDDVVLEISQPTAKVVRARITAGPEELVVASLGFEQSQKAAFNKQNPQSVPVVPPDLPIDRSLQEMEGISGYLSFGPMFSQIGELFPAAVKSFGLQRIAALVSSSCVVGMVVPGLHSMYLALDVSFLEDCPPAESIHFSVTSVVPRFRLVRIGITGPGLRGSLETMSRMPPIKQPSMDSVLPLVSRDEFRNSTALIVGGSRGLGELTSKLIAAGGGRVFSTYATGRSDGNAVAREIERAGLQCTMIAYDVYRSAADQLATSNVVPTHVYYFATPAIFRRKAGVFDSKRFAEFNLFYVTAFFDLVMACIRLNPNGVKVFYPSSTAVTVRPATMTEYAMSKAAAETLCADLSKYVPGVEVLTRRLPRLPTDQTSSVMDAQSADSIKVILPIVRDMHR